MIPHGYIAEWRAQAPWPDDFQVEQDLVISRALVEIFSHPVLRDALAFRGGTALYKLHLRPARYSEDIDLVQTRAEPAGPMMDALRSVLDPSLGKPRWKQTREHFSVYGLKEIPFKVSSLRALYQRRRGRDLFDLAIALKSPDTNPLRVIETFSKYMDHGGHI